VHSAALEITGISGRFSLLHHLHISGRPPACFSQFTISLHWNTECLLPALPTVWSCCIFLSLHFLAILGHCLISSHFIPGSTAHHFSGTSLLFLHWEECLSLDFYCTLPASFGISRPPGSLTLCLHSLPFPGLTAISPATYSFRFLSACCTGSLVFYMDACTLGCTALEFLLSCLFSRLSPLLEVPGGVSHRLCNLCDSLSARLRGSHRFCLSFLTASASYYLYMPVLEWFLCLFSFLDFLCLHNLGWSLFYCLLHLGAPGGAALEHCTSIFSPHSSLSATTSHSFLGPLTPAHLTLSGGTTHHYHSSFLSPLWRFGYTGSHSLLGFSFLCLLFCLLSLLHLSLSCTSSLVLLISLFALTLGGFRSLPFTFCG